MSCLDFEICIAEMQLYFLLYLKSHNSTESLSILVYLKSMILYLFLFSISELDSVKQTVTIFVFVI